MHVSAYSINQDSLDDEGDPIGFDILDMRNTIISLLKRNPISLMNGRLSSNHFLHRQLQP